MKTEEILSFFATSVQVATENCPFCSFYSRTMERRNIKCYTSFKRDFIVVCYRTSFIEIDVGTAEQSTGK